jgi:hypothetical protein
MSEETAGMGFYLFFFKKAAKRPVYQKLASWQTQARGS